MSASYASEVVPVPSAESPLPEDGPRLLLAPPLPSSASGRGDSPTPGLVRLVTIAESLLADPAEGAAPLAAADVRRRVAAVAALLRDAAGAVAAADSEVEAARAEAARIRAAAEEAVARLWRTVSADVATRRAATDAFVTRARERAEREADAIVADASARADELLARAEDLVTAWLDEANAEVVRILEAAPPDGEIRLLSAVDPPRRQRRGFWAWLFRRS